MQVKNLRMYNIHRSNEFDNLWVPGNIIHVDENFPNSHCAFARTKTMEEIQSLINKNVNQLDDLDDVMSSERRYYVDMIRNRLEYYTYIQKEIALEEARKRYCPNKPSRYTSMWLANDKSLEYWRSLILGDVYELEVTGILTRSNDALIPKDLEIPQSRPLLIKEARKYWNPLRVLLEDREKDEFLFQGEAKIIQLVK